MNEESLWGDEFFVAPKEKVKKIVDKINNPKNIKTPTEKKVKSKSLTLEERLQLINEEVFRILGKQQDNVIVIKDKEEYLDYVDKAIRYGRIAVDTETNNSLDPVTCKIMGLCLYYERAKQAYIPINHRNHNTKERFSWQLTESDIAEGLKRISVGNSNNVKVITHNGKFDYQVIKCTCGVELKIDWDTLIGAKLLDENERSAKLKNQYVEKIDLEQEKYSIDHLFENVEYADVDPYIFALYAATDSMMTDKLYQWQMDKLKNNSLSRVLSLANDIEMPLVTVIAEIELAGMAVDQTYAKLLSRKFHDKLDKIDSKISSELDKLASKINAWRLTPEANFHPAGKDDAKVKKSKNEQLEDPINLGSPTQLAILFYDVLKCPQVSKKSPRGTGEDELKAIADKLHTPICDLLLERREVVKLLTTYIDVIPELAKRWPDGRVRTHFNQYGAATGRLSSGDPINFQNIPSHEKTIRMLFCSPSITNEVEEIDGWFIVPETDEVQMKDLSRRFVGELNVGDCIFINDTELVSVLQIIKDHKLYKIKLSG